MTEDEIDEIKALARLALKNAFYADFSDLVNKYLAMGVGLEENLIAAQLQVATGIYGCDDKAEGDAWINLYVTTPSGRTYNVDTLIEALDDDDAFTIHLQGKLIFKRLNGDWFYFGDEK